VKPQNLSRKKQRKKEVENKTCGSSSNEVRERNDFKQNQTSVYAVKSLKHLG
jgi:hypothetical protein